LDSFVDWFGKLVAEGGHGNGDVTATVLLGFVGLFLLALALFGRGKKR